MLRVDLCIADIPPAAIERTDEVTIDDVTADGVGIDSVTGLLEPESCRPGHLAGVGVRNANERAPIERNVPWHTIPQNPPRLLALWSCLLPICSARAMPPRNYCVSGISAVRDSMHTRNAPGFNGCW